jgi:predicted DNA-binding protein
MAKDKRLQVRLSQEEFARLRDYALQVGSSVSDVLREMIRKLQTPTKDL